MITNTHTHTSSDIPADKLGLADGELLVVLIDNGNGGSANTNEADSTSVGGQLSSTLSGHSVGWIEDGTSYKLLSIKYILRGGN